MHQVPTMWDIVADPDKLFSVPQELGVEQDVIEGQNGRRVAAGHGKALSAATNTPPGFRPNPLVIVARLTLLDSHGNATTAVNHDTWRRTALKPKKISATLPRSLRLERQARHLVRK